MQRKHDHFVRSQLPDYLDISYPDAAGDEWSFKVLQDQGRDLQKPPVMELTALNVT